MGEMQEGKRQKEHMKYGKNEKPNTAERRWVLRSIKYLVLLNI